MELMEFTLIYPPDIKYFSGRHIAYALIAIFCITFIVIGLPLLYYCLSQYWEERFHFSRWNLF